jgi:tetratricopeptide (TPR) repeat protein
MWKCLLVAAVLAAAPCALGQTPPPQNKDQQQPPIPATNQAPPRSQGRGPGDSSSRDIEPEAPPSAPDDSVTELRAWDPHKAAKNVEVGNYYFRQHNYHAALSRYCEALQYKPDDAIATFRVAEALEKLDDLAGARTYYAAYLKILPAGPSAEHSRKELERLKGQAEIANKHLAQQAGCESAKAAKFRPEPLDPDRPVLTRNPASPPGKSQ